MKGIFGLAAAMLFAATACSGDSTGLSTNLSGAWQFSENFSNSTLQMSCTSTGTVNMSHTGSSLAGNFTQTGICTAPSIGTVDNSGSGTIVGGQVSGNRVSFQSGECTYTGTLTGSPANRITGTVTCVIALVGQTFTFNGTWQAGR
jgi:hypothetical protein